VEEGLHFFSPAKKMGRDWQPYRTELLTHVMTTRKTKAKKPSKPPLAIRTFSLTTKNDSLLSEIAGTASDSLGWTVSSSAIVRALLEFAGEQGSDWLTQEIISRVEKEIATGRVWGTKKEISPTIII
jgi:hypothetical protein